MGCPKERVRGDFPAFGGHPCYACGRKERDLAQMPKGITRSTFVKRPLILSLALWGVLLPSSMQAAPDASALATGAWGGEHIILDVSDKGAELEFDCAHGQVTQPITVDRHGNFDIAGTFTPEHGGPVRRDENTPPAPARYSGHVDGSAMSLTVTLGKETVGVFTLSRGSRPNLTKCR
jgi:hypothetical protein